MRYAAEQPALDQWYCIEALQDVHGSMDNPLLGTDLTVSKGSDGIISVSVKEDGRPLPTREQYGYLWTTLGTPKLPLFAIPETKKDDRRVVVCGAVSVKASGLRIVENFLDMAHFPFVHTDILGAEPNTEVLHYTTEIRRDVDEVWATNCQFFQPQAALSATGGIMTQYIYRVSTPFTTLLYKTCPNAENRWDVICLFVQPVEPDFCRAHPVMFLIDDVSTIEALIEFQQLIFLRDRIILENQRPKLMPLDARLEIPTRADASSIAYRRWLKEKGIVYGTKCGSMSDTFTPADIAIVNATVLPMGGAAQIANGCVTIRGDAISYVGPMNEAEIAGAKRVIDAKQQVVMPGFVNCHTHIASNMLLRGLLEDVKLFEWLQTMWRLKRNFDPETLYWASKMGLVEMVKSGFTCFNEHFDAYAVEPEIRALSEIPMRATLGYGFADRGLYADITDWSWKALHNFGDKVKKHHKTGSDRIHVALSPHAPYSCGAEMFRLVRQVADEHKVVIHTHLAEGMQEVAYVRETYNTTPVQWVHSLGFLGPDVTAAHSTQLTDDDIRIYAETGTKVAHCPCCNAKLGSGTMRLRDLQKAGVTVGLATDGPASHNSLDMFEEMKFAGLVHKDKTGDVEFLKTRELLELATTGAAAAMNRTDVGRLAAGMKADVIVVDLDKPHCLPVYDEAAALVYSARADDVVTTIVDGEVLMENRRMTGVDEAEIRFEFRKRALALRDRSI